MPWRDVAGGGFTDPGVVPWLPFGDLAACNVEEQRADPDSMLNLARDLIALAQGPTRPAVGLLPDPGGDRRGRGRGAGGGGSGGGQHVR